MENQVITSENQVIRNERGQVISGTPNPNGRPKGTYSLKTLIEKKLKENPELEAKLIADILEKEQALVYQMIDGRPKQSTELDGKLDITTPVLVKFIDGENNNNTSRI